MKAVVIREPGGSEVLAIQDRPVPEPAHEQILVRIFAAGLNRADISQRQGRYPSPPGSPPDVPGLEFAGEVAALGTGAQGVKVGDRVYGICGGGGQAEYVVVHARSVAPVPDSLEWVEAGGVPETFMTVHDALFTRAQLALGETVLIHAVGSGIGTTAVQLAHATGARAFGTSRTAAKLDRARDELGLDAGFVGEGFAEAVLAATDGAGVDVVLDSVGGPYLAGNLGALAMKGRMVVLATMGGSQEAIPLRHLTAKRLTLMGTVLRARPLEEKVAVTRAFAHHVNPLLSQRRVRPIIDRVFELDEVAAAYTYLESNESFGKVVLRIR